MSGTALKHADVQATQAIIISNRPHDLARCSRTAKPNSGMPLRSCAPNVSSVSVPTKAAYALKTGVRPPVILPRLTWRTGPGVLATTFLCPLLFLIAPGASAQTPVGPGNISNYSAGGSGSAGGKGHDGNPDLFENHDGGQGGHGGPGPTSNIGVVSGTTVSASSGIAVQVVATGGSGGAGGNGETEISGQSGNGGGGNDGGGGGSSQLTLDADVSVKSAAGQAILLSADGGAGGNGGQAANSGTGGRGGAGGAAGSVSFQADAGSTIQTSGTAGSAVRLEADGGTPGISQPTSYAATSNVYGPGGAFGGAGGAIQGSFSGTITATNTAVFAQSRGSDAGDGASSSTQFGSAYGGTGGTGASGGTVTLQFLSGSSTTVSTAPTNGNLVAAGVAQSIGGAGGNGGTASAGYGNAHSGQGGASGNGGSATVDAQGAMIVTTGGTAAGLLAQSIGGKGGSSASANAIFSATGGKGAAGGSGGAATVDIGLSDGNTLIETAGGDAAALVAQSVGGGGGYGGSASAIALGKALSIGGQGGTGGVAGLATVSMTAGVAGDPVPTVLTTGLRSSAMMAQSVGGGGGNGGSASAINFGVVSLTVGGSAGNGGGGGAADGTNLGTLQTEGNHSVGLEAQSIGGGGGNGGAADSLQIGVQLNIAVTIGGNGGKGGNAGSATATNDGQIVTMGSDSYGLQVQSIGGGGGVGGASVSEAVQLFNTADVEPNIPSALVNVAIGGSGGTAGNGSTVTVDNENALITTGAKAYGILAQSVGGGGGDGGDSSAINISLQAPTVSVTTAIGGSGGAGGQGGAVTATNNGLILTLGTGADGIFAQSTGGGGGNGGYAQADTGAFLSSDKTVQVTVTVGGSGGSAGNGGSVSASNILGGIVTRGDGASGMFAQSVGGGGGNGNFSKALGSGGGTLNVNVAVGGGGGGGGTGGTVTVDNRGAILTTGASAPGITAQSVGGGGGNGGDASSGAGTDPEVRAADFIAGGLGIGASVVQTGNGIYTLKDDTTGDFDVLGKLKNIVTGYDSENDPKAPPAEEGKPEDAPSLSVDVGAGFGSHGGSAGGGGKITVTNEGSIQTDDTGSNGISAQSIGGGGGAGGASNPAPSNNQLPAATAIDAAIGVGGQGGSSGSGGEIDVTNLGSIATSGDLSNGVYAQSIGGGGGTGGLTLAQSGVLGKLTIAVGGNGGSNGDGGPVNVTVGPAPPNGTSWITTTGRDASAILAQSIGGGGGLSALMGTTVAPNSGGRGQSNTGVINDTTLPSTSILSLKIDGTTGTSGNGGPVNITLNKSSGIAYAGYVQTVGIDSYGVLAQSIGGGGGLVVGVPDANASSTLRDMFSAGASRGNGGTVSVTLENGFSMGTAGAGAVGILAQSIGGGGALVGGLSHVRLDSAIVATPVSETGQGGNVTVDFESGGNLVTSGAGAHGIVAMSLGGGGGIVDQSDGNGFAFAGSTPFNAKAAGVAPTGTVNIILGTNTVVRASGANAYPIYAASQGNGTNAVKINVGSDGYVESWAQSPAAIFISGAGSSGNNVIDNAGTIDDGTSDAVPGGRTPNATGVAIAGNAPFTLNNTGTVNGSVANGGGTMVNNETGGIFNAGSAIDLGRDGQLSNQGLLTIGNASSDVSTTQLTGNLSQGASGTLLVRLNARSNQADRLLVTGTAQMAGQVALQVINPAALKPGSARVNIVTADGGVTASALKATLTASPILQYMPVQSGSNAVSVSYTVDFSGNGALQAQGPGSGDLVNVGNVINAVQDNGGAEGLASLVAALTELHSPQALANLYDSLSGAATADVQQVLFGAQQAYQSTILDHIWNQSGASSSASVEASSPAGQPTEVWVGGVGRNDMLEGTGGQRSLHAQTAGALIGIDHHMDDGREAYGLSIGGGSSNLSVAQEDSRGHDTSVNVAAYGIVWRNEIYLSGVLSYGNFSTDLYRYNIAGVAALLASGHQTFDSNMAGGRIELGWAHRIGALNVAPYAAIDLDELWQGTFSEDASGGSASANSGLALRYASVSQLSAPLTLGSRLSTSLLLDGTRRFDPYLDLGWVHEFNPTRSINAAFLAAPDVPFKVYGVSASRNAALTSIGGTLGLTRQLSLLASFNGQFSGVETAYGGFGGLQLTW